jgi:hypothetical protein
MIKWSRYIEDKLIKELYRFGITKELLINVIDDPDEVLYDLMTGRYVALKMKHKIAVIYEKLGKEKFIITAIYSSKLEDVVRNRRRVGRWI